MIEYTVFSHGQGSGYVASDPEAHRSLTGFRAEAITVGNEKLAPGIPSDCAGFFCRQLPYLGLIDENGLLFLIGSKPGLFPEYLYQLVYRIDENRLYENFNHGSGRDFRLINGKWK